MYAEFPNGPFADPALYLTGSNRRSAVLFDCGDLSRFAPARLLRIDTIFLSHCHIDHFFAFDLFLRVNIGVEKSVAIYGPPETSLRVGGKLQGYTWNLLGDQDSSFVVFDLDPAAGTKTRTEFHAKDRFHATEPVLESWNVAEPVYTAADFAVRALPLDHRTLSLSYAAQTLPSTSVAAEELEPMGLRAGPWINELKRHSLEGEIEVTTLARTKERRNARELAKRLLVARPPIKIVYATDGAASAENRARLLPFLRDADLFFSETCFLEEDRALADDTKHFTAKFIAELAAEAGVKRLAPFHFSKRYVDCPEKVLAETAKYFRGELVTVPKLNESPV